MCEFPIWNLKLCSVAYLNIWQNNMEITVNAEENKLHDDRRSHTEIQHSLRRFSVPEQSGGRTRSSLIALLLLTMTFWSSLSSAVNRTQTSIQYNTLISSTDFHGSKTNTICVNFDSILRTCTWDKSPIIIRTVKINCYTILPAALCLAFVFSSFGVLQLKLYPLWPKVFDATAFSYLTWTLTMCLLNKYNAAGILQERGGA